MLTVINDMIDTHAHLDRITDINAVIGRAQQSGLTAIVAVGIDYRSNNFVLDLAEQFPQFILPALGYHPEYAGETAGEIQLTLKFIADNIDKSVAVGEIGLDYLKWIKNKAGKDAQKQVFKDALWLAEKFGKPVLVHSRYSWRDSLTLVNESKIEKAVFHWYTGPLGILDDIIARDHCISATPAVAYHMEHRQAVGAIPIENLLLETDTPVVYREGIGANRPSEPADLVNVLKVVAKLQNVNEEVVNLTTTMNAKSFFNLDHS